MNEPNQYYDVIFGVSNDGGKTAVAWRDDIHEAFKYLDLQNRAGVTSYAVVAVRKYKKVETQKAKVLTYRGSTVAHTQLVDIPADYDFETDDPYGDKIPFSLGSNQQLLPLEDDFKGISLICLAPDGEYVVEGRDFGSIDDAWERASDMGSRWCFYPVHFVCDNGAERLILDVPNGMPDAWKGKPLKSLLQVFGANSDEVVSYCEGGGPFPIWP